MATLERAIEIAVEAHRGQTDKAGQPYILHPLWLMQQFEDTEARIIAVLHDAVEDSDLSVAKLSSEGFDPKIVKAIDALTHRDDESYDDYINRVQTHPTALLVKLADLEHNMDVRRISQVQQRDLARLEKYHKTWHKLREAAGF